jgi:hypothetical protein
MQDPIKKITKAKKGLGHGSSGRAPAQQAQVPEFKSQYLREKNPSMYILASSRFILFVFSSS